MRLDKVLLDLAAEQRSCVGIWQARELGARQTEIARLRRSQLWTPIGKHVLAVAGAVVDKLGEASASVLAAGSGAVLSHEPGAALWGVPGFRLLPTEMSQTHNSARRRGLRGRVHDLEVVPERWVTTYKGIRVVRPELAMYQLAARINPDRLARAFDTAWSMGLLSGASARACLQEMRKSGRNGTSVYASILEVRGADYTPTTTNLEGRVAQLAEQARIKLRRQINLGGELWDGRVDFIEDEVKLVVEVQSEQYHAALSDRVADERRRAALEADGFEVLEVWDSDVWTRGAYVVGRLRQAVRAAKATRFSPSERHRSVSF